MLTTHCHAICQHHTLPQSQFSCLNLSSFSISLLTPVPTKLLFISELNLDNNLLTTLSGIDQFMNLQSLSVNFNFISEKNELLWVKNRFLLKELSFVGNQIQNRVTAGWLKGQGFTGLVRLNEVSRIGNVPRNDSTYIENESPRFLGGLSFSKPINDSNRKLKNIRMSPQSNNNQQSQQATETKRHPFGSNRHLSSQIMNQTDPDITQRLYKRKDRFQSTGDTRNPRITTNKLRGQFSKQASSFYSSPQFNNHSFQQYGNGQQYNMSSTKRANITEFRLYPVDEEQPGRGRHRVKVTSQAGYYGASNKSKPQYRQVRPFHEIEQEGVGYQNYSQYRSEIYELDQRGTRMRTKSQQSDNYIIEREIPVYKQAIAIAFYYRNLLQKVFRGYNQLLAQRQNKEISQKEQEVDSHNTTMNRQDSINVETSQQTISSHQNQLELKRYAWMKLQLYVNHKKITQKYRKSLNGNK